MSQATDEVARLFIAGASIQACPDSRETSLNELVFLAASGALADAGMTRADVDGVVLGANDQLDGRAISSMQLAGPAGGYLRDEVKVTGDGLLALCAAGLRMEAGLGHATLVVSWTKSSESDPAGAVGVDPDPVFGRPVGLHPFAAEAAVCGDFASRRGIPPNAFDARALEVAGLTGPDDITCWPLRGMHSPPPSDAAVAIVLTTRETPVELAGFHFEWDVDDPSRRRRTPESFVSDVAARALYDAQVHGALLAPGARVETTDRNLFRYAMTLLGLGLSTPERIVDDVARGVTGCNTSGGLWSSNPIVAAGLERVVHVARAVRDERAPFGLAHSSFGIAGQGQAAAVVRGVS